MLAVLVILALMAGALTCLIIPARSGGPSISIGVVSYEPWAKRGPSLMVRVGITNTGSKALRYNQLNFDGGAWLRVQSRAGWATRDIGPGAVLPSMPALLRPGSNVCIFIALPEGALRWQIGYHARSASLRKRFTERIPPPWRARLGFLTARLSDKEGPEAEVTSVVFECPHNDPPAVDDGMSPLFD